MIQSEPSLYYMLFRDLIEDDDNHPFGGYVYISDDDLKEIAILWRLRNSFIDPLTEDQIISEADLLELDREFLTEHSAEKIPKRSVRLEFNYWLNDPNAGSIPPYSYARNLLGSHLAASASVRYLENWIRTYKAFFADYNPINNYDMLEHEGHKNEGTGESHGHDLGKIYGANSVTGAPSNSSDTDTGTSTTEEGERTLTRSGNIGVVTSQQMIQSELDLRRQNFADILFRDLDKLLNLEVMRI